MTKTRKYEIVGLVLTAIVAGLVFMFLNTDIPGTRENVAVELAEHLSDNGMTIGSSVDSVVKLADTMCELRDREINVNYWLESQGYTQSEQFALQAVFNSGWCEL